MQESVIRWVSHPEAFRIGGTDHARWDAISNELHWNYGVWGLVAENEKVGPITRQLRKRGIEVTCRGVKGGEAREVYARRVPDFMDVKWKDPHLSDEEVEKILKEFK